MNKVYVMISLLFILGIYSASAEVQNLGTFKQYSCVQIVQSCSNCSYVNLTSILLPNGVVSNINQKMTKNGFIYNYTYCSTSQLGQYIPTTCGDVDSIDTCVSYNFEITTTGKLGSNTVIIFLLISGFVLLALSLFQKEAMIGFASGVLLSIAGVFMLIYGLTLFQDVYTQAISYVSLFLGIIICFASIYEQFTEE